MAKKTSGKKKPRLDLSTLEKNLIKALASGKKTLKEAAIEAGYSPKNPTQSGAQALAAIRKKTPEHMDELGLTVPVLIERHLTPLLRAEETKVFVFEGERNPKSKRRPKREVMKVKIPDFTTRRYGTRLAFELQGAFPPADPKLAAQIGVKVLIVDIPRPSRDEKVDS